MKTKIDINNWRGAKHFKWFESYFEPTYTMTCDLDVTKVYQYSKQKGLSYFIIVLYLINKALNEIEEMRLRIEDGEVYLYDIIHPAYTVMTNDGVFDNCENDYNDNFYEFYEITKQAINKAKLGVDNEQSYNDLTRFDQFYFTCLPWISFTSLTHPLPHDSSYSVPRIAWGKYQEKDGKVIMPLNMAVCHSIVDGYPLALAFNNIQNYFNNCDQYL